MDNNPIFLIQKISLQWNKDCRGGKGAVLRNSYPKAASLPKDYFSYYPCGIPSHYIGLFQDKDGIHVKKECRNLNEWTADGIIGFAPYELSVQNGKVKIHYCYNLHHGRRPQRSKYDSTRNRYVPLHELAFELNPGDYGQAICNGRFVDYDTGNWYYELIILNIILLSDTDVSLDCFLTKEPNKKYQRIDQLW